MVDGDSDMVSVSEAARRLGISRAAIRSRIKHGSLVSMTDNHGNPLVRLPLPPSSNAPPETSMVVSPGTLQEARQPRLDAPGLLSLSDVRQLLGEQQTAHSAALAALRADMETERQRHDSEVERLVGQVHAERSFWIERADAAEVRAEAAEQRLADSRRPWWSRWLGASKRSDIG